MNKYYHNLQKSNNRRPASWKEFIRYCNERGVKIIKNTQTHWWDITTRSTAPRFYRVNYIQDGCTNSIVIRAVNEDDIRDKLEGVQILSIEAVEHDNLPGTQENNFLVWYRAADKTMNKQTITAKDKEDVFRIFEGIEIVSIEAVTPDTEPGTRGNI